MAGRKQKYISDGSDSDDTNERSSADGYDSQEDDDSRAERRLFERRQRKRPRTGQSGKDAAWEGLFGEEDVGTQRSYGAGIGSSRGAQAGSSQALRTKAPTFVSSRRASSREQDSGFQDSTSPSEDPLRTVSPQPPTTDDDDEDDDDDADLRPSLGEARAKSSLLFSRDAQSKENVPTVEPEKASAFSRRVTAFRDSIAQPTNTERLNFQHSRSSTPLTAPKAADLSNADKAHLSKVSGSFGANMLRKFGWTPGKGLGLGDGLAVPIAVKLLNKGEGIKSGIRTEESKREARRKGDMADEHTQETAKASKAQRVERLRSDDWRKHKRVKVKVEHKTYEQLIAEDDSTKAGVGLVLDARGGDLRAVNSLSELSISGWTPTSDTSQLPELRHNLRLMSDLAAGSVANLVQEGKSVNGRRRWAIREEERSHNKVEMSNDAISRLTQVRGVVSEIAALSKHAAQSGVASLSTIELQLNRLLSDFKDEYAELSLDEVVVGAIDLILQSAFSSWQPLDISSSVLLSTLKPWRKAFNLESGEESKSAGSDRTMTPWESLLWHRWLPKVRSAINNDWTPENPWPAVHLMESWDVLLPDFIRDNVLDQLVLPKLSVAVESFVGGANRGRKQTALASFVFPWLPLLGERHSEILEQGKRRIRALLRKWKPSDGVPEELAQWRRDVYSPREWDALMGDYVLGKLGSTLRDVAINPRNQDLGTIVKYVMPWHTLLRLSHFTRLFELEFFPRWLDVLYLWLVHPGYNGEEVAQWFEMWKSLFPSAVLQHKAIARGFGVGVELMGQALSLGPSAPASLQRPSYVPLSRESETMDTVNKAARTPRTSRTTPHNDITFRDIADEYISGQDLLMVPLGRSHATTGKPLFRVGKTIDGKGGVNIYIEEDAIFAESQGGLYHASTLADVVKLAKTR